MLKFYQNKMTGALVAALDTNTKEIIELEESGANWQKSPDNISSLEINGRKVIRG